MPLLLGWPVPVHVRAKSNEIDAGFINKGGHFTLLRLPGVMIISSVFAGKAWNTTEKI